VVPDDLRDQRSDEHYDYEETDCLAHHSPVEVVQAGL
jgi:hypothetical protein